MWEEAGHLASWVLEVESGKGICEFKTSNQYSY